MFPYNSKVWTTPLEQMSKSWIAERVATVDFRRLLENVLYERDDNGWGPNSKFRFPKYGGTGEIYRRMVKRFPDKIKTGKELAAVDDRQRTRFVRRRHGRYLRRADLHRPPRSAGRNAGIERRQTNRSGGISSTTT